MGMNVSVCKVQMVAWWSNDVGLGIKTSGCDVILMKPYKCPMSAYLTVLSRVLDFNPDENVNMFFFPAGKNLKLDE